MLGTSYPGDGLVSQSTHWSTLWVDHNSPRDFTQDSSPSHSILIAPFLAFIKISDKAYYTGTPTMVITDTDIYGSQATIMMPVLACLVGAPINIAGGRFTTRTGLSTSIFSFVNRTTGRWSAHSFTITENADNYTPVDELSTLLSLHDFVALV